MLLAMTPSYYTKQSAYEYEYFNEKKEIQSTCNFSPSVSSDDMFHIQPEDEWLVEHLKQYKFPLKPYKKTVLERCRDAISFTKIALSNIKNRNSQVSPA
jgi:Zn-finger domain-containing protein